MELFNNREIAIISWGGLFFLWCLIKGIGESIFNFFKALANKSILQIIFLMYSYIFFIVLGLKEIDLWSLTDIKGLIYWSVGVGFVMLMNSHSSNNDEHYFKNRVIEILKLTIVIEYLIALVVFKFWVEAIIFPILTTFVMLQAYSSLHEEYKVVENFSTSILAAYVLALLGYSIYEISLDANKYATLDQFIDILLPPIYTFTFLPFIYFIILYSTYEILFVRMTFFIEEDRELLKYAKWKVIKKFHVRLYSLKEWTKDIHRYELHSKDGIDRSLK